MMTDDEVIPSFLNKIEEGAYRDITSQFYNNTLMRIGEVRAIIPPDDKRNISKLFTEYDVYVAHRENGTKVGKMYQNCITANPFGGVADLVDYTYRIDTERGISEDKKKVANPGYGSKVLIQCVNGDHSTAVIIGGLRDIGNTTRADSTAGHHLRFIFNGVKFQVNDDGSWNIFFGGKTTERGKPDDSVDQDVTGTALGVTADGSLKASTRDGAEEISLDHASSQATLHAKAINIGRGANEAAVLGDTLISIMDEWLEIKMNEQFPTAVGPTGLSLALPKYAAVRLKLRTALSEFIKVKKTP